MHKRLWLMAGVIGVSAVVGLSWTAAQGGQGTQDKILKKFAEEFILLTPGQGTYPASFMMGSADGPAAEQPAHKVTFNYAFAIAKYEVTQELWEAVIGKNPAKWRGPRNSVEMLDWDEANAFCRKVTAELRQRKLIKEGEEIRLPSESEWEYACRAGTMTRFSFGDKAEELGQYCWFTGNAKGNDPPVGVKKPNAWGLYDIHGYLWEWCLDAWHPDYKDAPSDGRPRQADSPKERVLRGGAWTATADQCRSAYRGHRPPTARGPDIGLRCVRAAGDNR
jgi:formylglycine-generating enzyme required for sulfatase activity